MHTAHQHADGDLGFRSKSIFCGVFKLAFELCRGLEIVRVRETQASLRIGHQLDKSLDRQRILREARVIETLNANVFDVPLDLRIKVRDLVVRLAKLIAEQLEVSVEHCLIERFPLIHISISDRIEDSRNIILVVRGTIQG